MLTDPRQRTGMSRTSAFRLWRLMPAMSSAGAASFSQARINMRYFSENSSGISTALTISLIIETL